MTYSIVSWNSAGGILKFQPVAVLGETEHTVFAIVIGHEDDPDSGHWFNAGDVVWFDKIDVWEFESAIHHSDVH
jgi:hypothetical protein